MKTIILFALNFLVSVAMGQTIKGKVVNSENNVGIPYASIGILGTSFGTTCDSLGFFLLHLNKTDSIFNKSQSITVTSIGYDTLNISPNVSLDIIRLKPQPIVLETVNIRVNNRNVKEKILGNNREKGRVWVTFNPTKRTLSQNMGTAIGSVFNVRADKIASLISFKCFAYPTGFNMVKYRVLAIDVVTKKNLLNDELFYTWKAGNPKNIEIDFSSTPIELKNDFILALEWVDYEINKGSERQNIMLPANISFSSKALWRLGSQNQWQAMKNINVSFQATIVY